MDYTNVITSTTSSHHYCFFDVLHEGNTKNPNEVLRRIGLVPQLAGFFNTQVHTRFMKELIIYIIRNLLG